MPLLNTSGNVTADAYGGGKAVVPNYIEDVFSTYLWTGTSAARSINNGIDLSTKGGMVWIKDRTVGNNNVVFDTARGASKLLITNQTGGQSTDTATLTSFNTNGFSVDYYSTVNESPDNYVGWTFRKQPKFFDVVTYTGNGTAGQTVAHNLGSFPGAIFVKATSTTGNWGGWVRTGSTAGAGGISLNSTAASAQTLPNSYVGDSTIFYPYWMQDKDTNIGNVNGVTYVAYLFAHNAGGFGLTGTDNVISCGSFTTDGSGNATVNLGYEPQWVLVKSSTNAENWYLVDNMRGFPVSGDNKALLPNLSNAEGSFSQPNITNTGFAYIGGNASRTYIYIAIRRGPMKVPTDATKVFAPTAWTGTGTNSTVTTNFVTDSVISHARNVAGRWPVVYDRLRGTDKAIWTSQTDAEGTSAVASCNFQTNIGYNLGVDSDFRGINQGGGTTYGEWAFARAPSFFDEVCYTGDGATFQTLTHNLGAQPELVIVKARGTAPSGMGAGTFGAFGDWWLWSKAVTDSVGANAILRLNTTTATTNLGGSFSPITNVTSTSFRVIYDSFGPPQVTNGIAVGYVAYLFATCPGVSKVGSYTGTGATQTINCGFTSGARFVMIKATSTTGNWLVFDTARGMTTSTDPWLALNSTAAESATTGACTTTSVGFTVDESKLTGVNTNGVSYIALAVA